MTDDHRNDFRLGGKFGVAWFHTHPPMKYAGEDDVRSVGPSQIDEDSIAKAELPGFVYDYIGTYDPKKGYNAVYSGDEIDKQKKIYPYGLERRPNIEFETEPIN